MKFFLVVISGGGGGCPPPLKRTVSGATTADTSTIYLPAPVDTRTPHTHSPHAFHSTVAVDSPFMLFYFLTANPRECGNVTSRP